MWIFLVIIGIFVWGMLSRNSASHPINAVPNQNVSSLVCSAKNTAGDSFSSGCTFTPGVSEPHISLVCGDGFLTCHAIVAHFPIDPPPLAIQKTPLTPAIGLPTRTAPLADVPVATAPKPIFPVPVGYHNNILPVKSTNPVLLPQAKPATAVNPWQPGTFKWRAWERLQAGKKTKSIAVNTNPFISGTGAVVKTGSYFGGFHFGGDCNSLGGGGGVTG